MVDTLGERLDALARRLAARWLPAPPWVAPLTVLMDREAALSAQLDGRFDRYESTVDGHRREPRQPGRTAAAPAAAARPAPAASDGRPLPDGVRARLREIAGPGADAMRTHEGSTADALARTHRADAVTVGRDVYFRQGRFRPYDQRGFGLLAHEATHVLRLLQPGVAWRRATGAGVHEEETEALSRERAAVHPQPAPLNGRRAGPPTAPPAPPAQAPAAAVAAAPAAQPMPAATDRDTGTAPAQPTVDFAALRRDLLNDLMRQLRTEFERGG